MRLKKFYKETRNFAKKDTPDIFEVKKIEKAKRRIPILRYAGAIAIALVLVFAILLGQNYRNDEVDTTVDKTILFNKGSIFESAKRYMPDDVTQKKITLEEYMEFLGKDPRPKWLPDDMKEYTYDILLWYYPDGSIFDSSHYFVYSSNHEDYTSRQIGITVDKDKLPIRDFLIEGDAIVSNLKGVDITAGHTVMGCDYGEDGIAKKYYDYYYADFIHNGIGYRVEAQRGVTEEEVIRVILSLID